MHSQISNIWHKACLVVGVVLLLGACASSHLFEHGIDISVQGVEPIYDVEVLYGKRDIHFRGKRPPGSGGGWNAYMPVPDSMTVQWTSRGELKRERVSLVGKTSPTDRLANWKLVFQDDHLEVFRVDDDPGSKYYFKKPVQVYP